MRREDAKALLGLLGECCCDGDPPRLEGAPLMPLVTRPAVTASGGRTVGSMPERRAVQPDEPFVPPPPSFDTPQRPGRFGSRLHVPGTNESGQFMELGTNAADELAVVLDDGELWRLMQPVAVDHDERTISWRTERTQEPDLSDKPIGLSVPHTAEGRSTTSLNYFGQEEDVVPNLLGQRTWTFFEARQHYDGAISEDAVGTATQNLNAWDFDWVLKYSPDPHSPFPAIEHAHATPDADGFKYRVLEITLYGMETGYRTLQYLQMHAHDYKLRGDRALGFETPTSEWGSFRNLHDEVTTILGYERDENGTITTTRVNAWVNFAEAEIGRSDTFPVPQPDDDGYPIGQKLWGEVRLTGDTGGGYAWVQIGWFNRTIGSLSEILREIKPAAAPAGPTVPDVRFTALDGAVTVTGPRTTQPALLEDSQQQPNATLTAWGHQFTGGSWAALRDRPKRRKDDTWDYEQFIVLHAGAGVVTAVRPEGAPESCTLAQFEVGVLRIAAGKFRAFSSAGAFSHSWPPEWVWCDTGEDSQSV